MICQIHAGFVSLVFYTVENGNVNYNFPELILLRWELIQIQFIKETKK